MRLSGFARATWAVLVYNIGVILWGAYVRATGSGAGCGQHWPLCNGEVIPRAPAVETLIEFSHRVSSGLALLLAFGLFYWAYRAYPRGHTVRLGATLVVLFTATEALVGAGLVLFQLVGQNDSMTRAFATSLHLVNTFFLLASLTLAAFWASGGNRVRLAGYGGRTWLLGVGLLGVLVIGTTGAVTALGDTLFPASSLVEGLRQDFSPTAHFLIRLRTIHPAIAVGVSIYLLLLARVMAPSLAIPTVQPLANALVALVVVQLLAGAVNVVLLAPVPMQMLHLLLADLLWITLVLFAATILPAEMPVRGHRELPGRTAPSIG